MRLLAAIFIVLLSKSGASESLNNETFQNNLEEGEYFEEEEISGLDLASREGINMTELERFCLNISEQLNATKHRGFLHGFSESVTVILVSEIGDKTFFIAAIMAMRNNKLIIFLSALSALYLMTVLSALLGWVVTTFIPREITYYTCTAIMFLFGLKMLWEAWRMEEDEVQETQKEVEQELADMDGTRNVGAAERGETNEGYTSPGPAILDINTGGTESKAAQQEDPESDGIKSHAMNFLSKYIIAKPRNPPADLCPSEGVAGDSPPAASQPHTESRQPDQSWMDNVIDRSCKENSWFGKKCLKIFKLFVNCFTMTFIAEWGDRSQLATIVLAGLNDVWGVVVGGCLGHTICTGGAVLVGVIIARFISARVITLIGALVFLGFAIASIFTDPQADGIDGIPDIAGYDNCTRLINHNITQTLHMEDTDYDNYY